MQHCIKTYQHSEVCLVVQGLALERVMQWGTYAMVVAQRQWQCASLITLNTNTLLITLSWVMPGSTLNLSMICIPCHTWWPDTLVQPSAFEQHQHDQICKQDGKVSNHPATVFWNSTRSACWTLQKKKFWYSTLPECRFQSSCQLHNQHEPEELKKIGGFLMIHMCSAEASSTASCNFVMLRPAEWLHACIPCKMFAFLEHCKHSFRTGWVCNVDSHSVTCMSRFSTTQIAWSHLPAVFITYNCSNYVESKSQCVPWSLAVHEMHIRAVCCVVCCLCV